VSISRRQFVPVTGIHNDPEVRQDASIRSLCLCAGPIKFSFVAWDSVADKKKAKSYPGLTFFDPSFISGSIWTRSTLCPASRGVVECFSWLPVTATADGVTARLDCFTGTLSTVTGFLLAVCGSATDWVGPGYGLAHSSSSTTAPGRDPKGVGVRSLGDAIGVASVMKTAGGRRGCSAVCAVLVGGACSRRL